MSDSEKKNIEKKTISKNAGFEQTNDSEIHQEKVLVSEKFLSWKNILLIAIIIISWATPNVIGRYLVEAYNLAPIHISFFRYLPAAITLIILLLIKKQMKEFFRTFKKVYFHFIITGIILSTFLLLQMYSVKFTTASASSFLLNVNPIITYLLAFLILKEEHQWWGFIGVIVSIGGVFLIAVPIDEIGNLFASQLFLGNIMAFLSGFAWAVYSIYIKRFLKKEDPVICTTWSIIVSTIILCIAMVIFEGGFPQNLNWVSTCLLLFMGIIPTAIAFTLWLYVIGKTPVQKLSVFQFLIPIIATLLAVLFLNETLNKFFYIGAGLIIIGLLITQKA